MRGRSHRAGARRRIEAETDRRSVTAVRAVLAAAALALSASSVLSLEGLREERELVATRVAGAPLAEETRQVLDRRISRATTPSEIRFEVASHIVEVEIDALARPSPVEEPDASVRRLELAADLAAEAFALRPSAWEAPTLQGAATYLARRLAADRRLVTDSRAWDAPLTRGRKLAPGIDDPHRFAASAYLELWNGLSPEKREEAVTLLQRAFASPRTFGRLLGPWLDLAEEPADALAVMPDLPHVWDGLQRELAARGLWSAFFETRESWRDALERSFDARLAAAERRRRGGDLTTARELYLEVVADAPREDRFLPVVERALAAAPPGPWQPRLGERLRPWLERELALDLVGRRELPPELVDRLAGLVGDLPEPVEARAALASGRLPDAERLERQAPLSRWHEDWQPYWIVKARELLVRGHVGEARAALGRVADEWTEHPEYLHIRRHLTAGGDEPAVRATADSRLGDPAEGSLRSRPWRRSRRHAETDLYLADAVGSLRLGFRTAPPGAAVELLVDGKVLAAGRVRPGRDLRVGVDLAPGGHLVELRTIAGPDPTPGSLTAGHGDPGRGGPAADDG